MKAKVTKKGECNYIIVKDDDFVVVLCDLGASIYAIKNGDDFLTLTHKNVSTFVSDKHYHGKTIGRCANRIKGNEIEIDGIKYKIENNEVNSTLHGGLNGLSNKTFDYAINDIGDTIVVTFTYKSPHLESGFPGNLSITVEYRIFKGKNEIMVRLLASSDQKTICNLTNHTYFSLASESNHDLKLFMRSNEYLKTSSEDLLPICRETLTPALDFTTFKSIGQDIDSPELNTNRFKGYDHNFYFTKVSGVIPQIILKSDKYSLQIRTDFEGAQIFTDNFDDDCEFCRTSKTKRRGVAIEPQDDISKLNYLDKDKLYSRFIKYTFFKN